MMQRYLHAVSPLGKAKQWHTLSTFLAELRREPTPVSRHSSAHAPTSNVTLFSLKILKCQNKHRARSLHREGLASSLNVGTNSPEISKTFKVPMDSSEITLEFDFYETADQASDNEVSLRMNNVYLDLVSFVSATSEGTKMGIFGDPAASITISGNNHNVQPTIPATCYPVGRLMLGFKVDTRLPLRLLATTTSCYHQYVL
jgi:hypothetical protein